MKQLLFFLLCSASLAEAMAGNHTPIRDRILKEQKKLETHLTNVQERLTEIAHAKDKETEGSPAYNDFTERYKEVSAAKYRIRAKLARILLLLRRADEEGLPEETLARLFTAYQRGGQHRSKSAPLPEGRPASPFTSSSVPTTPHYNGKGTPFQAILEEDEEQ